MASNMNDSTDSDNTCVVCCKNIEIFSLGPCDHPVCYECSVRIRVLCKQKECPICRTEMPTVFFINQIVPFKHVNFKFYSDRNLHSPEYGIVFADYNIKKNFDILLESRCKYCLSIFFKNFESLSDHLKKVHKLYYCDLCVENLKIFIFERKFYNKDELERHFKKGDLNDKSYRGHPLCKFCNKHYVDQDELYRHLRRDHLYCHFCDADGLKHFYDTYQSLREHFRNDHFLCEEGNCKNEEFTSVFRSEIDLRAHKASNHEKELGKKLTKQTRTLDLEFRITPRPGAQSTSRAAASSVTLGDLLPEMNNGCDFLDNVMLGGSKQNQNMSKKKKQNNKPINVLDPELFPSLNGNSSSSKNFLSMQRGGGGGASGSNARHQARNPVCGPLLLKNNQNFPALSGGGSDFQINVSSEPSTQASFSNKPASLVVQVNNHRQTSSQPLSNNQNANNNVQPTNKNSFPTLSTEPSTSQFIAPKWIQPKPKKEVQPVVVQPLIKKTICTDSRAEFPTLSSNQLTSMALYSVASIRSQTNDNIKPLVVSKKSVKNNLTKTNQTKKLTKSKTVANKTTNQAKMAKLQPSSSSSTSNAPVPLMSLNLFNKKSYFDNTGGTNNINEVIETYFEKLKKNGAVDDGSSSSNNNNSNNNNKVQNNICVNNITKNSASISKIIDDDGFVTKLKKNKNKNSQKTDEINSAQVVNDKKDKKKNAKEKNKNKKNDENVEELNKNLKNKQSVAKTNDVNPSLSLNKENKDETNKSSKKQKLKNKDLNDINSDDSNLMRMNVENEKELLKHDNNDKNLLKKDRNNIDTTIDKNTEIIKKSDENLVAKKSDENLAVKKCDENKKNCKNIDEIVKVDEKIYEIGKINKNLDGILSKLNTNKSESKKIENNQVSIEQLKNNSDMLTQTIKTPPGFDKPKNSIVNIPPPPGFKKKPPPGFTVPDSVASINSNDENYPVLTQTTLTYIKPPNFGLRNQKLIENFQKKLSNSKINDLMYKSYQFKQGIIKPRDYLKFCKTLMGENYKDLFGEMLFLLPDIEKQNELFDECLIYPEAWQVCKCDVCKQIVTKSDLEHHMNSHSNKPSTSINHFPSL